MKNHSLLGCICGRRKARHETVLPIAAMILSLAGVAVIVKTAIECNIMREICNMDIEEKECGENEIDNLHQTVCSPEFSKGYIDS